MSKRRVELTRSEAIVAALEALAHGQPSDIKKLTGVEPPRWRLRIGRFRAIFAFDRERIIVEHIGDRRDVYR